jgi:tetratricopeptide (TPR) repeat protein
MYEQMERDFINFLSLAEVRRIGDSLDRLERYSYDHFFTAASAALEELFFRVPRNSFNNSATAALEAFERLKNFPEAEYWIGEVFRIEGDLPLALSQYHRAYSMRDSLENPGFSTLILYKIASIHQIRQEYNEMERILLSIVNDFDTLWSDAARAEAGRINPDVFAQRIPYAQASASFARTGMTRILQDHGIERFLEMYRYNNGIVEEAHRLLGFYYVVRGRAGAQPHLMFAFLIQNTTIIEEARRRRFDFTFTDLPALMEEANRSELLLSYIEEVEYFKTAYYLGAALLRNGHPSIANGLWSFLATQPQAGQWRNRALMQLQNPRVETIIDSP